VSDLDEASLARWMRGAVPGFSDLRAMQKFSDGQSNPTYRIDTAGGPFVLRRKPFGTLLPSAHAVDREFRLLSALHPTGFPVPGPVALCEDEAVIGSVFYLMEMVDGRTFWDGTLPDVAKGDRRPLYAAMIDTMAALHAIDHETVGLADFGAPGNYVQRQVERWTKQYRAAQTDDIPEMDRLIDWLPRTLPEQSLTTIGDPLADFAYLAMNWAIPRDGRSGLGGVDLEAAGLPALDEAVARYCAASRRDSLPDLHWYFAYNLFRLVGIIQGIKKRIADGNASSTQAAETVAKLVPFAKAAWAEANKAGATW
jgi:aminoglycoside phosphotransferase (APT) family kinase protein